MGRPEHLSVPNTPEGIRRINDEQSLYDEDPSRYEAEQQAQQDAMMREREEEEMARAEHEAQCAAEAEAEAQYYAEQE